MKKSLSLRCLYHYGTTIVRLQLGSFLCSPAVQCLLSSSHGQMKVDHGMNDFFAVDLSSMSLLCHLTLFVKFHVISPLLYQLYILNQFVALKQRFSNCTGEPKGP